MGVHGANVVPALVLQAVDVHLTDRHHGVGLFTLDGVAVHVERLVELVIATHLLQLLIGRAHDGGVDESDTGQRLGVGLQLARLRVGFGRVVLDFDVLDVVGGPRRRDVALDVGPFLIGLVGAHADALHHGRVDGADDDPAEHQQGGRQNREDPAAQDGVGEEHQRTQHGNGGEDRLGGDPGVVVGVGKAGQQAVVGELEGVAVQPLLHGVQQQCDTQQNGDVGRSLVRGQPAPAGVAQRAHHVVHQRRADGAQHERRHQAGGDEAIPRVIEDEKAHVDAEAWIDGVEVGALQPRQEGRGLAGGHCAGEEPDDGPDPDQHPGQPRLQQITPTFEELRGDLGAAHRRT